MGLLSKAERDFLVSKDKVDHDYYCVKSRLLKKLNVFISQELPLLQQKGYLPELCKQRNLAENCKVHHNHYHDDVAMATSSSLSQEQKGVGRKGFEPLTPAMSRRYPNQARPPALHTQCKNLFPKYML